MSRFSGAQPYAPAFAKGRNKGAQAVARDQRRREADGRLRRANGRPRSDCHGAVTYKVPAGGIACAACGNGCNVREAAA
jgi:hypothetical protein